MVTALADSELTTARMPFVDSRQEGDSSVILKVPQPFSRDQPCRNMFVKIKLQSLLTRMANQERRKGVC